MSPHRNLLMLLFVSWLLSGNPLPQPDCPNPYKCGDLTIPYPFGPQEGCYLSGEFRITCNSATGTAFLGGGNIAVMNISLEGQVTVSSMVARECYDGNWTLSSRDLTSELASYRVSSSMNKFVAIGCDTKAFVGSQQFATGCFSLCNTSASVVNGSCSGIGCCQTSIPKDVEDYSVNVTSYSDDADDTMEKNSCRSAFIVQDGVYNFSSLDLANPSDLTSPGLNSMKKLPMIIDWAIRNGGNCNEARKDKAKYACTENTDCNNTDSPPGYRCSCSHGYSGNPYLPNGCQDDDECSSGHHQCIRPENCLNTPGNYTCFCPEGQTGDGRSPGKGCTDISPKKKDNHSFKAADASIAAGSLLILIICCAYWWVQRRNAKNAKEDLFKENGGLMLQGLLSKVERTEEKAKIFTEEQLSKATNYYCNSEIVGQGGYGTVYKGTLDNKLVAIKKSKVVDRGQTEQFINEVIVLSRIKHPNAVKLIGCCLETSVPMLVYEFITNNTLHYHIHDESHAKPLRWSTRLRIAAETASTLAYMHFDAPIQIIHRDVKSSNILLDHNFNAKVSDFGASRLVPLDHTQLPTIVQGTIGYLDPEYFHTGMFTDKSDVYSFGVVLMELLTGQKVLCPNRQDKDKSLVTFFTSAMKRDSLLLILDERVKYEGEPEQLTQVARLAMRCVRLEGAERPTMKEVEKELKELTGVDERLRDASYNLDHGEESQPFVAHTTKSIDYTGSTSSMYSYRSHQILQLTDMSLGR